MTKRNKNIVIWALIIAAVYFFVDYHLYQKDLMKRMSGAMENQSFIIKSGWNTGTVATHLEDEKIIVSGNSFKRYISSQHLENKLQQGRFQISPGMTIPEIAEILSDAKKAQTILTVPEGYSIKQIDKKLSDLGITQEGDFINATNVYGRPLEGYLFPDTYFLNAGNFSPENLITMMSQNFENKTKEMFQGKNEKEIREIVIVASLLEKEVRTQKDLPIVAGIIWKRLQNGWFLNIDATHLYSDSNEYDTYKIKGLPPSPIGNPGIETLKATLHPESSPYWFYLTKPQTGEVVYAKTNDEQNRNRAKYLSGQ